MSEKDKVLRDKITGAISLLESKTLSNNKDWLDCSSGSDGSDDDDNDNEDSEVKVPWEKIGDLHSQEDESISEDESYADDENDELLDTELNWKSNLAEKAANAFIEGQLDQSNLYKLVYG